MILYIILGILLCFIVFCILVYFENKKLRVTEYHVTSSRLPDAFAGYRIAHLTDLHSNIYGKENQRLLDIINRSMPDCILISGDMIIKNEAFDGTSTFRLLEILARKYPIYYAYGNHEKKLSLHDNVKQKEFMEYKKQLEAIGIVFLVDDSVIVGKDGDHIQITGIDLDLQYYRKFRKQPLHPTTLVNQLPKQQLNCYQILLAHNPIYFEEYANWNADLVLSGHVHGGMVILPWVGGVISTQCLLFPKYDFGMFHIKHSTMILSRGLGNHSIRLRFHNPAEVCLVILEKET